MWNPRSAHYYLLGVGLIAILIIARDQWFFGDDWSILAPHLDSQIMGSRNGHWNLIPAVVFQAIRNLIGLGSYTPYLLCAIAAHLVVAHLLWRILNRCGLRAWGATAVAFLVILLGAGAENILWAFQFGFMGAVAVGLGVVLLMDSERLGPARIVGIVLLSLLAPTFSGTAIPVLVAAALVGWIRHGFLRTALMVAPAAVIYLAWYVHYVIQVPGASPGGVKTLDQALFALVFAGAMVAGGLGRALPWIGLGVIPAVAVVVWFVATVRRGFRSMELPAYALAIGALVFVLLTADTRSDDGLSSAAAERYAYVTIVLLLPAMSLLVARVVATRPRWTMVATVGVLCLVGFNAVTLELDGEDQARREAGSHHRVDATYLRVVNGHPTTLELDSPVDALWAVNLTGGDLRLLAKWGQYPAPH
jgi:hypothetical protein